MDNSLLYKIGITILPGVGDIIAKNLVAYCGSAESVFKESRPRLEKVPGIGSITANAITKKGVMQSALARAEKELLFIEKKNIIPLFFTDPEYPVRLKQCDDGPIMLYAKGEINLNEEKIVSIIGSRKATSYGKKICEQIIESFSSHHALIVSGLAYGIDVTAHRAALKNNLSTIGVLAHGLDLIYPGEHTATAEKMTEHGGLLTEFVSATKMNPEYFPRRNRIVAGMSDATIVIEATVKSGALITAEIANSYNRDVFAVPGRIDDISSEGCNLLIKANKAMLIQSAEDVIKALNWDVQNKKNNVQQRQLFENLSPEEEKLVAILKEKEKTHIDDLCISSKIPMNKTASLLLNLEFSGTIKSLPGKMYCLNN
ncbi:MAG TPA: DNA-processing protein DprA [Bacteroidia bacterium]